MSKAVLKEIREYIKLEKYTEAIKKCDKLLEDEPKNYMAYLLLGAAYQNTNKKEAARNLRKAIEYSPAAPTVALQGLTSCAPVEELPQIYEQLLELVPEKYEDYFIKLFGITSNPSVTLKCFEIFKKHSSNVNEEHRNVALKYLARMWVERELPLQNDNDEKLLITALEVAVEDAQIEIYLQCFKRYLKLLYKRKEMARCLREADRVIELYPEDVYAYEWICKIYCENYKNTTADSWWQELKNSIDFYATELLRLNLNSSLALLIEAIHLFKQEQFSAAHDRLQRVQIIQPNYPVALELLARTKMEFGSYEEALHLWQQLDNKENVISSNIAEKAECMSYSGDKELLTRSIDLLDKLEETESVLCMKARCFFKLGLVKKLQKLSLPILAHLEYISEPSEAIDKLKSSELAESFDKLLLLGKLQLQQLNYSDALTNLLKATRLRPHRSQCFLHLGQMYLATEDRVRARKCFEKCLHFNPLCEDAINNLSSLYQQLNEEDLNIALLLNTLKHMKDENKSKQIHYKLGLHYLRFNKWDDAIQSFRAAIKLDINCIAYWESLGDAYSGRGSHNSAIRVFQKIIEMDPSNKYSKFQLGNIKKIIRMYPEAIEDFNNLLQEHHSFVPALKGCAEAYLGLAHNLKLERRYGRCKQHLQTAADLLQRAFLVLRDHEMVWLWRLVATVFMQTALLPNSLANMDVSGKLAKQRSKSVFLSRKELFQLAARFYTCALKLKQNTFLWYELGLCAYYRAQYFPSEAAGHLDLALKACHMAIQQQDDRWQNWNFLGVVNMHSGVNNLPLAQHCFIQALYLDRKSYITWTNLGALYLKLGDIKLANLAFQRAQQSSPVYQNAWIGQAMIAEAIGEDEEALDLFRHCQQFEYHMESALGYAHWVCSILNDDIKRQRSHYKHAIESMYADVVALDAINWYIRNTEENAIISALTFKGFLSARKNLYRPAVEAYRQAVTKADDNTVRDKLNTNLGYLHLKLNQPLDAINAFNAVSQANFKPIIGLALAYYRAGQHQEAYSVYNSVLKSVTGSEDDKAALILVAMAAMVYASQGEADTKTILYQCILLKNSPIQALYSACALGILHKDTQLTETIINELKKYENNHEHCVHIAYLRAQYYLSQREIKQGLIYLIKRVHIFPACSGLRKILAIYMLDNCSSLPRYQMAISQMALGALRIGHTNKEHKHFYVEDSELLMIASSALQQIDKDRSLKLLQKAVHMNPQNTNGWKALIKIY